MKKSDLSVIVVNYIIAIVFFAATLAFPFDAQIYPFFIISLLVLINTIYLIKCLIKRKNGEKGENDLPIIFKDFQAKQFFVILLLCCLYIFLIAWLGFYTSTALYVIATMIFLKVPKKQLIIASVCFMVLIYATFTVFLKVPLPTGLFM